MPRSVYPTMRETIFQRRDDREFVTVELTKTRFPRGAIWKAIRFSTRKKNQDEHEDNRARPRFWRRCVQRDFRGKLPQPVSPAARIRGRNAMEVICRRSVDKAVSPWNMITPLSKQAIPRRAMGIKHCVSAARACNQRVACCLAGDVELRSPVDENHLQAPIAGLRQRSWGSIKRKTTFPVFGRHRARPIPNLKRAHDRNP